MDENNFSKLPKHFQSNTLQYHFYFGLVELLTQFLIVLKGMSNTQNVIKSDNQTNTEINIELYNEECNKFFTFYKNNFSDIESQLIGYYTFYFDFLKYNTELYFEGDKNYTSFIQKNVSEILNHPFFNYKNCDDLVSDFHNDYYNLTERFTIQYSKLMKQFDSESKFVKVCVNSPFVNWDFHYKIQNVKDVTNSFTKLINTFNTFFQYDTVFLN